MVDKHKTKAIDKLVSMNRDFNRFLHLLRCGIGEEDLCLPLFADGNMDWEYIYRQSEKQTVTGIIFDAVLGLPEEYLPPRELFLKWCAKVAQLEMLNEQMNMKLCELLDILEEQQIKAVLLKGQGMATLYPMPAHRTCGDIDLYVLPSDFYKTQQLFEQLACLPMECGEEKHLEYVYKNILVEIHHSVNRFNYPLSNWRFKKVVAKLFDNNLLETVTITNREVQILPATFNVFYLLTHTYYHILCGGVGLRQICDWVLLVRQKHNSIDQKLFSFYLKQFDFQKVYDAIAYVAVQYLGLDRKYLPVVINNKHAYYGEQVMKMIMWGGNFGKYKGEYAIKPTSSMRGRIRNFWEACVISWRFFAFCPTESIWFPIQKLRFYIKKL